MTFNKAIHLGELYVTFMLADRGLGAIRTPFSLRMTGETGQLHNSRSVCVRPPTVRAEDDWAAAEHGGRRVS